MKENENMEILVVRVNASIEARTRRGWKESSVDKDSTEVDLDDFKGISFTAINTLRMGYCIYE